VSDPERGIEQEVVAPAGAPSPPSDWDETAGAQAARAQAESAVQAARTASEGDAAQAGPEGDARGARPAVDGAAARPEVDAPGARPEVDAAGARPEVDAPEARPQVAAGARPEVDAPEARPQVDAAKAQPEGDAPEARPQVDAAGARPEVDAPEARPEVDAAKAQPEGDAPEAQPDGDAADAEGQQAPEDESAGEAHADLHERAGKADAYLELAQRTQADFDNYRKRMTREVRAAEARGIGRLARELLPAIDNLERALAAVDAAEPRHHLSEGIRLVTAELSAALGRTGIQGYDPKGERFDPVQHEAVAQQPVAGAEPGTVVEVLQAGYRLNEAILRPARVIVAS
jgi:molecular chaperone GrpE